MSNKKSNLNREFTGARNNAPKPTKQQAELSGTIKRDRPLLRPRPPGLGHSADAERFNQQWQRDVREFQKHARGPAHEHMSNQELRDTWRREMQSVRRFEQFRPIDKRRYIELHNNAQIVKRSGLKLADRFNQIKRRAQQRTQDKGRGR